MPVSLQNRTMITGDKGAALHKRIKSDKVVVMAPTNKTTMFLFRRIPFGTATSGYVPKQVRIPAWIATPIVHITLRLSFAPDVGICGQCFFIRISEMNDVRSKGYRKHSSEHIFPFFIRKFLPEFRSVRRRLECRQLYICRQGSELPGMFRTPQDALCTI